ncbi:uncharacterized protein PRCAT00002642001 [Priceomyces carsonii]|uniref:uncharacterized protein n=1 Tax=Priceomyces carsonii TaxID=28549 RepID=UPI002ED8A600|nr:unnamed protein product [Priceomyces carsonii]
MNSILHTCTHSNDDTLTRMTEDQMYAAIFKYIEHLFEIIKPQKVFYMAIDGVAPRAKMNQQRARRFRSAVEAEENLKKAIEKGLEIPKEDPFDTNAITPGTEFMAKLTENLKYFIHKKISEDSNWAGVQIILSGHEVPGEGEHKIMEYIRTMKSQDEYDPNLRHCIYGLDADLIMLGLVAHDPHFALLREEVTFGPKAAKKSTDVNDQTFFLLHLSLVREYLSLEFQELDNQLSFEYNFDRMLDDFILIMYVIGNDFLPNLPDLFINKGAFPLLIETFKQTLKQSDGYINENGTINLKRLDIWLNYLSEFELENFERQDVDVEWFNKRLEDISLTGEKKRERMGKLVLLKDQKKLVGLIKPWLLSTCSKKVDDLIKLEQIGKLPSLTLPKDEVSKHLDFIKRFALEVGIIIIHSKSQDSYETRLDLDGFSPNETDEEFEERINEVKKTIKKYQSANLFETEDLLKESKDIYDSKFLNWKDKYYKDKLHFSIYDKEKIIEITEHYLEGLQWVLYYYYKGCPSWNWYYKYHYAPRISDISVGLRELLKSKRKIEFEKSKPFKPFEQLMAVLPARSRNLMPIVYRPLMTDPHSPIIEFYPDKVDIDMNGKTASWEAVVLLSFVDEKELIRALAPLESKLLPDEKKRNSIGTDIEFIYNPQVDQVYNSPLPGFFNEIEHDKCFESNFIPPPVKNVKIGLVEGAKIGKDLLAGFPTLQTIPFTSKLSLEEIKVFQAPSRSESMILTIENIWEDISIHQFSEKFLGKIVYSNWPFLRESKVVKIEDSEYKYERKKVGNYKKVTASHLNSLEVLVFKQSVNSFASLYGKTKGVKLSNISGLVHVQPVTGLIRNAKGAYVKTFSKDIETYPVQLIVEEVSNEDPRFATRPPLPIEEEFPLNSQVVFLGDMAYGAPATVAGYNDLEKLSIKISKIQTNAEPNIGKQRYEMEKKEIKYYPSYEVAKTLRLHPLFLSKISSGFMVEDNKGRKVNVGLELKFEGRREKVLGFTKRNVKGWEFSPLAIKLIEDYRKHFPKFFEELKKLSTNSIPRIKEFSNDSELDEVRKWLKEAKSQLVRVSLESESLTKFSYQAIETFMDTYLQSNFPYVNKDIKGVPKDAVLNPSLSYQLLSDQKFELGDRIIYVQDSGKAPKLSRGTVVNINTFGNKISLGVIFDFPLISGNNMNGKLKSNRGVTIDSSLVLNITNKQFVYHSRASKDRKPLTPEQRAAKAKAVAAYKAKQNEITKEKNLRKTNELLTLLKKNVSSDEKSVSKDSKDEGEYINSDAIKHIYGQIYSNVMNEGIAPFVPPMIPSQAQMQQMPPVNSSGQLQVFDESGPKDAPFNGSTGGVSTRGKGGAKNGRGRDTSSRGSSRGFANRGRGSSVRGSSNRGNANRGNSAKESSTNNSSGNKKE